MKIGLLTITEWIAVIGFLAGLVFGFARLYSTLQSILTQLKALNANFDESKSDRELIHKELDQMRLDFIQQKTSVDERFKTVFKNLSELAKSEINHGKREAGNK